MGAGGGGVSTMRGLLDLVAVVIVIIWGVEKLRQGSYLGWLLLLLGLLDIITWAYEFGRIYG